MLLGLQIDEAVGWVPAGKRVNGNVDALAIKIRSQSAPSHSVSSWVKPGLGFWLFFQACGIHRELRRREKRLHILRLSSVGHVAHVQPAAL